MEARSTTEFQSKLTAKERATMVFCPCKYMNVPAMEIRDCCLCCHESPKYELLNIPPFIEIAGTLITPSNPINPYFVIFRFITMLYLLFVCFFSFGVFVSDAGVHYWIMYWTEWVLICGVTLNILRFISSYTVYRNIKTGKLDIDELIQFDNINDIDIDSKLWFLYKLHKIALYVTIPAMTMVVFNYWAFVYSGSGHFTTRLDGISSYQKHGTAALVIWIDFLISTEKIYYKALIWSNLLGIMFTIWTIIFEIFINENETGKEYIYSAYNWSESITTPLIYFFLSMFILTVFTALSTLIKNIILICSGIGDREKDDTDEQEPLADI